MTAARNGRAGVRALGAAVLAALLLAALLPVPEQPGHRSLITWPVPRHRPHVRVMEKKPCWTVTCPRPPHAPHRSAFVPFRAPLPPHSGQDDIRGMENSFSAPNAASSKAISML